MNMRGAARNGEESANHSSSIWVDLDLAPDARALQKQIRTRFDECVHWGCWYVTQNIGRLIGENGMRKVLRKLEKIEDHWVGFFTNAGSWRIGCGPIIGIAPAAPAAPFAAACLEVDGHLSLSIQVHPFLSVDQGQVNSWLARWCQEIFALEVAPRASLSDPTLAETPSAVHVVAPTAPHFSAEIPT